MRPFPDGVSGGISGGVPGSAPGRIPSTFPGGIPAVQPPSLPVPTAPPGYTTEVWGLPPTAYPPMPQPAVSPTPALTAIDSDSAPSCSPRPVAGISVRATMTPRDDADGGGGGGGGGGGAGSSLETPLPRVPWEHLRDLAIPSREGHFKTVRFMQYEPEGRPVAVLLLKDSRHSWDIESGIFHRLRGLACVPKVYGDVVSPDNRRCVRRRVPASSCVRL
jgi:hypothetical protein